MSSPSDANPYAPPRVDDTLATSDVSDAEQIRRAHLSHEYNVRSVGWLYLIVSVLLLLVFGLMVPAVVDGAVALDPTALVILGLLAAMTILGLVVGYRLRQVDPQIKTLATVLACLNLLAAPVGTLWGGLVLWLLHSRKGKMVLSPEYQHVIRATPHVRLRTSWPLVALLIVMVAAALVSLAVIGG